jgi:hypothetical protein
MKRIVLALVVLSVTSALAEDYQIGSATAYRYTTSSTTVGCTGSGYSTTCSAVDNSTEHALYSLTFAEGYTRIIEHVAFRRDPLKGIVAPTEIKYRIQRQHGIEYILVLDSDGKEGWYFPATRDDDPKRTPRSYGPAPVSDAK